VLGQPASRPAPHARPWPLITPPALAPPQRISARTAAAALVLVNVALGFGLAESRTAGIALAFLPAAVVLAWVLPAVNPAIFAFAALSLDFLYPIKVDQPLPLPGGVNLHVADVLVLLALASWALSRLSSSPGSRPRWPRTPVLGWPLALFSVVLVTAILRGHAAYGTTLFSIPLRLALYAGIGAAMTTLRPEQAYRGIVAVFYGGAVWQAIVGVYLLGTGGSTGSTAEISTGGSRVLAGSTAIYLAGSLLLALLSLRRETLARRQLLHLTIASLAAFGLALTFQRTTFAVLFLLVPLLFVTARGLTASVALYLPILVPFALLAWLVVPRLAPDLAPTLTQRVTASPAADTSARWRSAALETVLQQVRDSPVTGVGFGRQSSFTLRGVRVELSQDPHDQYIYLWAGGGLLLLGSFVLLVLAYLRDTLKRLRRLTGTAHLLVVWSLLLWLVFMVNAATGIVLTAEELLLAFWVLMLIPAAIARGDDESEKETIRASPV
jgi:O-antigen ligase